jgi:hypothetical protein
MPTEMTGRPVSAGASTDRLTGPPTSAELDAALEVEMRALVAQLEEALAARRVAGVVAAARALELLLTLHGHARAGAAFWRACARGADPE